MAEYTMKPGFKPVEVYQQCFDDRAYREWEIMGPTKDLVVKMRVPSDSCHDYVYRPVLSGCFVDAPGHIAQNLCNSIRLDRDPDQETMEYIYNPDFLEWARPIIMSRNRYSRDEKGEHRDIMDSVHRLLKLNLISYQDIDGALFRWEYGMREGAFGRCSQTKIVSISVKLDTELVPNSFIDGLVYHQCLHLRQLNECKWIRHDREFRQYMSLFPDSGMRYSPRSRDYRPIQDPQRPHPAKPKHIIRPLETYC